MPHGQRSLVLPLAGGVNVDAQDESGVAVSQHSGESLDVHAVLEGRGARYGRLWNQRGSMPCVLQNALVEGVAGTQVV